MKNRITTTASVVGLSVLLIVHFGAHMAPFSHHPNIIWVLFVGGFVLTFLATVLAATSLPRHWRSGGDVGRFLWCVTVLAGFAGLLVYGP